jgi:hypothetical protein
MESYGACNQIFQGIEVGKRMTIPSFNAKKVIIFPRFFPRFFPRLFAASMKQLIRYAVNEIDGQKKV